MDSSINASSNNSNTLERLHVYYAYRILGVQQKHFMALVALLQPSFKSNNQDLAFEQKGEIQ